MSSFVVPSLTAVRPRDHHDYADRIALSAATTDGVQMRTEDVRAWIAERRDANVFHVERIPFADLDQWWFEGVTGNLVHRSGRFFTIEGLHVIEHDGPHGDGPYREWQQPVIRQPEVGILGILAKEFDGVLHFLMQAKMEPGNPNLVQLSPTVQATRSNYTKAHGGTNVKLIEYFAPPDPERVIVDVLQAEQGSWFFRKSNRNMIVETVDDVPLWDDFCWLTLGQIAELMHEDETINMNSRSVLSCLPYQDITPRALFSDVQLLSWFTNERSRHDVRVRRIPLADVCGWKQGAEEIEHEDGRYFKVLAVAVKGSNREKISWTQPLVESVDLGVVAFLVRKIDGVPHVLVQARVDGGFLDTVELAPTVQCTPLNYAHLPAEERPPFLDLVQNAPRSRIRYEAIHSEEGGRFLGVRARYLVIDADEAIDPPPGYAWVTPAQLTALTRHGHYVNVEARTLLACINAAAAQPRGGA
ncbi:NDP-hexose 2,3-dehydratase [Kibdelosporangium aridum]|uniref:dTDP-4-dehydro-6-deoxy-alpha-D-glucopyranose 2,3-dehydratase n=2 Tax=Pseudonocardiaceae TaxID=2070 RepID=EVAA_AMYOR|nr:dTDP-4-dehydro-6-deoxy-alpha-D-glucopyranose 2,3-dehydratase EvaA [Kibdelosporangium aridum]O52793.1 RecName: Full=dTDP-4-dehydro-6-deoxy-alpha-D-glucopyranose 2,3-dehydratase; AltName: Full=2,3-dehydratase [Amycolatopsis orientalis]RSM87998.1 NDP-hexose 2,3-dehydratase [Kibdelosporangium aridum]CAA11763.1 PCZA361.3 [Amycolatopsis orientalis]